MVDTVKKCTFLVFCADRSQNFQAAQGSLVDLQEISSVDFLDALDMAKGCFLCFVEVFDNRPRRRYDRVAIGDAEPFQRCGVEMFYQPLVTLIGVEIPCRPLGYYRAGQLTDVAYKFFALCLEQLAPPVGKKALSWRQTQ